VAARPWPELPLLHTSIAGIFFWQRVLFDWSARVSPTDVGNAKIRSTQSATRLLLRRFFTVVVGEVLAKFCCSRRAWRVVQ